MADGSVTEAATGSAPLGQEGARGEPDVTRRTRPYGAVVCLLLAALSLALSFVFVAGPMRTVAHRKLGPVSTSFGRTVNLPTPRATVLAAPRTVEVAFRFHAFAFVPTQNLFQTGALDTGLRAEVSAPSDPHRDLVLITTLRDGFPFVATLINQPSVGREYSVRISVHEGRSISAWVDGKRQFSYSFAQPIAEPALDRVSAGTGFSRTRPFAGTVGRFSLDYREFRAGSNYVQLALQLAAALLAATALVLLLLRASASRTVLELLLLHRRPPATSAPRAPRIRRQVSRHAGALGLVLLVAGVGVLAAVTPPQNVLLQKSGERDIGPLDVRAGTRGGGRVLVANEPALFARAAALDVHYSFDMRAPRVPPRTKFSPLIVAGLVGNQGLTIELSYGGELSGLFGQRDLPGAARIVLVRHFPRDRWIRVEANVQRSRSFDFRVGNEQVRKYTFTRPNVAAAPQDLLVAGDGENSTGAGIRNLRVNVVLYRDPATSTINLLVRLAQILAILAAAGGAFLVARAALSRLVAAAKSVRRPLVLVVFATTGLGIIANFAVNLFHAQRAPYPYFARNTWLSFPDARFSDFLEVLGIFKSLRPYGNPFGSYPPVGYWLVAPFSWMREYAALYAFLALFVGFFVWWLLRAFTHGLARVEKVLVVVIALFSYPVVFALERANVDLLVFVIVLSGIAALEHHRDGLSAGWLGLAMAAKITPVLYLLVFLRGRRLRYIVVAVVVAALATVVAFLGFRGALTENTRGFREGLVGVQVQNDDGISSTQSNTSLLGFAQGVGYAINSTQGAKDVRHAGLPYVLTEMLIGTLLLAWYLRRHERSLWRALTLITIAMLLLPDISYEYRLIFLFLPLSLFVRSATIDTRTLRIACLFGLLLAPRVYFYLGNWFINTSVLLDAPLLVALGVAVVRDGVSERQRQREESDAAADVVAERLPVEPVYI